MNIQGSYTLSTPQNERVRDYTPEDSDTKSLKTKLKELASKQFEIPCIIAGKEIRTGEMKDVVSPHDHQKVLAKAHFASEKELTMAADASMKAKQEWASSSPEFRIRIFQKAADLLAGPYRDLLNASTMLGQSKNVYQAEIDAACEMIDFFRFNNVFYQDILRGQPIQSPGISNALDYRPLDGFVLSITPFNFTAIAGNLVSAPALCGNTVVWKPSDTQLFSAYFTMLLLKEAGLPDGVINFVPADGPLTSKVLLPRKDLAGIHFTGSTKTFQTLWKSAAQNLEHYASYPRIVGETGGKDFIFAHASADPDALVTAMVRGAFEYQGQKCSAASRAYIPRTLWKKIESSLKSEVESIRVGDVSDFSNFMNAVIDQRAFDRISKTLSEAKSTNGVEVFSGGKFDGSKGYFVDPSILLCSDPKAKTMCEEIFGPVLSVYVYEESQFQETLKICESTSPYALTGAIFSQDRNVALQMSEELRFSAGNFYINDKPTGAVVGQQPFGGSRASGTNDKAGSALNLYRWISPRTVKENFVPPKNYRYPFLG